MKILIAFAIAIVYLGSGFLAYGILYAYFQRAFPSLADKYRDSDQTFAAFAAMLGPMGLFAAVIFVRFASTFGWQGFKWK